VVGLDDGAGEQMEMAAAVFRMIFSQPDPHGRAARRVRSHKWCGQRRPGSSRWRAARSQGHGLEPW